VIASSAAKPASARALSVFPSLGELVIYRLAPEEMAD
jgi:hypothetical protein